MAEKSDLTAKEKRYFKKLNAWVVAWDRDLRRWRKTLNATNLDKLRKVFVSMVGKGGGGNNPPPPPSWPPP